MQESLLRKSLIRSTSWIDRLVGDECRDGDNYTFSLMGLRIWSRLIWETCSLKERTLSGLRIQPVVPLDKHGKKSRRPARGDAGCPFRKTYGGPMKTFAILIGCIGLTFATWSMACAHESSAGKSGSKEPRVYCCHGKNDCDKLHTKSECEKDGGKVVKSCKECK